ncbi:RICIN domain-containing protein [Nonomuraea purpurea]|uniref:RICIN domain-containing protein n=1 Tax=Nonomuraea purpurea TaxID=1849276 RepID=A0ABV8G156_9ACTN
MRTHSRELLLVLGGAVVLSPIFGVLAGVYVNFATDSEPELNPVYILPAILFACGGALLSSLGAGLPWSRPKADLPAFKGRLKERRKEAGTPKFATLQPRAARRGFAFEQADLRKVTGKGVGWLKEPQTAEPVILAFLLVHDVPDAEAEQWLESYRGLAGPPPTRRRRVRLVLGVALPVVLAAAACLLYVDTRIPGWLARADQTILSAYAHGKPLVVNTSSSAPPHARLGESITHEVPGQAQRWDFEPARRDGVFLFRIRNRASRLCLTPEASDVTEGSFVTEAACDAGDQLWRLPGDHALAIASPRGEMCAEPSRGVTTEGTPLILRACADRPAQRWLITTRLPNLGSSLASAQNGHCVDAAGPAGLLLWECHGGLNQAFGYQPRARGEYVITSMGRCLAATGPVGGRRPVREPCTGSGGQLWRFDPRDHFNDWQYWEVRNVATDLCLHLESDLRSLYLRPCTRANVQQWRTPDWLRPPDAPALP